MATPAAAPAPDATGPFYVDNDEETYSILLEMAFNVEPRLEPLFQRLRQDPVDATAWKRWTEQCVRQGIQVPAYSPYQPEKASTGASQQKLPALFDTPAGQAHLKSLQAILNIDAVTAAQITLSCLRDATAEPAVCGSHAWLEKVLDYAYRQRIVRLRVLAEALRAEMDPHHGYNVPFGRLLDALDQKSVVPDGTNSSRGLFVFLLLTACAGQTESLTREQLLPAQALWVRSAEEKRDEITQQAEWKALGHRIIARTTDYIGEARQEALEALAVLFYARMEKSGLSRADYALLLTAFHEQGFFTKYSASPRMGHLAGLIGVEACLLNKTTAGGNWKTEHYLVREADGVAATERSNLLKMMSAMVSASADNRPQGLIALSLGCLLHLAGYAEGYPLATLAVESCATDVYLEETMSQLVEPPSTEAPVVDLEWYLKVQKNADPDESAEAEIPDLSAPCMLYASVGRELVIALLSTFGDILLDTTRGAFLENLNVAAKLVQVTHCNSGELCFSTWGDWEELGTRERRIAGSPFCRVIYLAQDLATTCASHIATRNYKKALEAVAPILKLVASLAPDSTFVCDAMEEFLPPSFLNTALDTCRLATRSTVHGEGSNEQRFCEEILHSISLLVSVARTAESKAKIRNSIIAATSNDNNFGPLGLFKIASSIGSAEALRLITLIVAGLLPGAPLDWFVQASSGLDLLQQSTKGGNFGFVRAPTEALVHLTHTMVLHANKLFFVNGVKDDTIVAGLNALTRALTVLSGVLTSSTSALSGRLFDGAPLPDKIAAKILMTLGNALIMVRPLYFTHPSPKVQSAILDNLDCVVKNVAMKTGLGGSVLFFATLPAALGLASAMKDTARDIELSKTVRGSRSQWGAASARAASSEAMLAARVEELDKIPVNLSALETAGFLREDSALSVREVSMAAMRLLILVFEHMNSVEYKREDYDLGMDPRETNPCDIVVSEALPSLAVRQSSELASGWSYSRVRYIQLLLRQLRMDGKEQCLSLVGFAVLRNYLSAASQDLVWSLSSPPLFRSVIDFTLKKLKENVAPGKALSEIEAWNAAICLDTLKLCLDSNWNVFSPKKESEKWSFLVEFVLSIQKRSPGVSSQEVILCNACLQLLLSVRKRQVALNEEEYFTVDNAFMFAVASLAFKDYRQASMFSDGWTSSEILQKSHAVRLASTAMQFIALEVQCVSRAPNVAGSAVVTSVIGVVENVSDLSLWIDETLSMEATPFFMKRVVASRDAIRKQVGLHPEVVCDLMRLYGGEGASESLSKWLHSFRGNPSFSPNFQETMDKLYSTYVYFKQEMTKTEAGSCLLSLLFRDRQHLRNLGASFSAQTCLRIARSLDANTQSIEDAATSISVYGLVRTVSQRIESLASLLVELTSHSGSSWEHGNIVELLNMLRQSARRMLLQLGGQRQHCFVVGNLLHVATSVASLIENPRIAGNDSRYEIMRLHADLAGIACQILRRFDHSDPTIWERKKNVEKTARCFRGIVAFLRKVCVFAKSSEESKHFSEMLSRALIEGDVSSALVTSISDPLIRRNIGPDGILSIFRLFQLVTTLGNKSLLLSLLTSVLRPALAANFKSQSDNVVIASIAMRGYIPLRNKELRLSPLQKSHTVASQASFQIGDDDQLHEIQIASTAFLANALRVVANGRAYRDETSKAISSIAFDYLGNFGERFLHCLYQTSRVSFHSETKNLTIRSLRESTSILSLVAELCRRNNIDEFKRRFPFFFKSFIEAATSVAWGMCSFLGASGASRELFRALGDEDGGLQNGDSFGFSPLVHVISASLSNPRHEAIHYSHLVSRCSAAVTKEEHDLQRKFPGNWKPPQVGSSRDDPNSEASLEKKCKLIVSSQFAFTIEEQAGSCLFHAIDIIMKTHPMKSSFAMFSAKELQELNPNKFVKVGTIIGYLDSGTICYGKVQSIDDFSRTWTVELHDPDVSEARRIRFEQLVGVEDHALRRPALKFDPAPESSAESDKSGSILSVGHLISALRWCHEFSCQVGRKSSVTKLAEILSILLGMEVSLSREKLQKSSERFKRSVDVLALQILDLFGAEGEVTSSSEDQIGGYRREGRLNLILTPDTWEKVRHQLKPELDMGMRDVIEREKKRPKTDGDGWMRRSPSKSIRSPFRQISM